MAPKIKLIIKKNKFAKIILDMFVDLFRRALQIYLQHRQASYILAMQI